MAYANFNSVSLRDSAATSGASEQDAAVTLPESVSEIWVTVKKTAEENADNLLTVRLQAQVNSLWFDLSWDTLSETASLTAANDSTNISTTRTPNIVNASSGPATTITAFYKSLPTPVVRTVSVSSGTDVSHTFSVNAEFRMTRS